MYFILFIAIALASYSVQAMLKSRFEKYSEVPTPDRMTGAEVARRMLEDHGITGVRITHVEGTLTDHYNPINRTLNLSDSVYSDCSIAAAAVAAHECGHAVQHSRGYLPLKLRSALVPAVNFASGTVSWLLILGLLFFKSFPHLIWVALGLYAITTLFTFITLPVEINASARAISWLKKSGITHGETSAMAFDALKWAAYTYVIAALGSLATLFYYFSLARGGRR